ncbi:MAG: hypothetical protein CMD25_07570 [Flavobacteriales bacterium]|nr:hypothetical protein [Flavobacteriales bacterium]
MQPPKLPSFFKTKNPKKFNYKPRYLNSIKTRNDNNLKRKINFSSKKSNSTNLKRSSRIIILIIILYLLAYNLLIK